MTEKNMDTNAIMLWLSSRCGLNVDVQQAANTTLAQAGIDSLEIVSISMDLEDNFGLRIDLERLSADSSLADIVARLLPLD